VITISVIDNSGSNFTKDAAECYRQMDDIKIVNLHNSNLSYLDKIEINYKKKYAPHITSTIIHFSMKLKRV
jgi:hypothetical protein